jgi:hypothetical protein
MATNEEKNEMLVMVLSDLAAICKKLSENSAVTEHLRTEAGQFVEEFNSLAPYRGSGTPAQHFRGENLMVRIARFLPRLLEVQAVPARSGN